MSDDNPYSKGNNPFYQGGDNDSATTNVPQPDADGGQGLPPMPSSEPLTTKPRQMPSGGGGGMDPLASGTDSNVPQGADTSKAARYIHRHNPHLTPAQVQYLARKVVANDGAFANNPFAHSMGQAPAPVTWKKPRMQGFSEDLNNPDSKWSPLHPNHPQYAKYQGMSDAQRGDLNNSANPNSPLHPDHPMNAVYRGGQMLKTRMGSLDQMVAFFDQFSDDDEGEAPAPLIL